MNEEREHQVRKEKYKRLKKKIYVQRGFRWIIEAMTTGPLGHIDLMWFTRDPETGAPRYYETIPYEARFHRACDKLKRKRAVLVGHNCFTDLIYLYSAFIGKLPNTVSEFRLRIHDLFPCVVDTKYMFTHNCGNLNPMSSLDSIEEALRVQNVPRIETHKEHGKYITDELYHEAGYDSYLTARVVILLSAKLEAKRKYVIESGANAPLPGTPSGGAQVAPSPPIPPSQQAVKKSSPPQSRTTSRFATKTLFEALADDDGSEEQDVEATVVGSSFALNPNTRPFPTVAASGDGAVESSSDAKKQVRDASKGKEKKQKKEELKPDTLMPPFSSDFWRLYANKLRVFGTVEGLLDLDPMRMQ